MRRSISFLIFVLIISSVFLLVITSFAFDLHHPVYKFFVYKPQKDIEFKVWKNKYMPGTDVLTEKLLKLLVDYLTDSSFAEVYTPDTGVSPNECDFIIKWRIYRFKLKRSSSLGTKTKGIATFWVGVYNKEGKLLWRDVITKKSGRWYPFLKEKLSDFWYWDEFKKSIYWDTLKSGVFELAKRLVDDFYIKGRIIAKLKDNRKRYGNQYKDEFVINVGKYEGIKEGDILEVVYFQNVLTEDPSHKVVVIPRKKGKVRVILVKRHESVVEVVEEKDKDKNPIKVGDVVIKRVFIRKL